MPSVQRRVTFQTLAREHDIQVGQGAGQGIEWLGKIDDRDVAGADPSVSTIQLSDITSLAVELNQDMILALQRFGATEPLAGS